MEWSEILALFGGSAVAAAFVTSLSARRNLVYASRDARRRELCDELAAVNSSVLAAYQGVSYSGIGVPQIPQEAKSQAGVLWSALEEGELLLSRKCRKAFKKMREALLAPFSYSSYAAAHNILHHGYAERQALLAQEKSKAVPVLWPRKLLRFLRTVYSRWWTEPQFSWTSYAETLPLPYLTGMVRLLARHEDLKRVSNVEFDLAYSIGKFSVSWQVRFAPDKKGFEILRELKRKIVVRAIEKSITDITKSEGVRVSRYRWSEGEVKRRGWQLREH